MNELYINRIEILKDKIPNSTRYPFNIRCIEELREINLNSNVTFLYGENGVGKSTLLEAIAINLGINPEGGSENFNFSTYDDYSELYKYIRIGKYGTPKTKFFLRAESFFNVASYISEEQQGYDHQYGGDLHQCSHGESFLKIIENRFWNNGLYILDEPEAALSPSRQMTLLCYINDLAKKGSQFIIATHSPIILAYKNSVILDLNNGLKEIKYENTEVYKIYKDFINNPEGMQKMLFEE